MATNPKLQCAGMKRLTQPATLIPKSIDSFLLKASPSTKNEDF